MRENLMSGIDGGGAGNGAAPQAICGSRVGVLENATTMAWSGPSLLVPATAPALYPT